MTKKAIRERCQNILYNVPDIKGEDFDFLLTLLESHPHSEQKIGCGVVRIWSDRNPVYTNTRNFWLERIDGTTTDWSFTECISPTNTFKAACRNSVHPQIKAYRKLNNMDSTRHADHHPESFDSVLNRFTQSNGQGKVKMNEDNQYGCFLKDEGYEKKWQDFHQQEAVLRNITAEENLKKKKCG